MLGYLDYEEDKKVYQALGSGAQDSTVVEEQPDKSNSKPEGKASKEQQDKHDDAEDECLDALLEKDNQRKTNNPKGKRKNLRQRSTSSTRRRKTKNMQRQMRNKSEQHHPR